MRNPLESSATPKDLEDQKRQLTWINPFFSEPDKCWKLRSHFKVLVYNDLKHTVKADVVKAKKWDVFAVTKSITWCQPSRAFWLLMKTDNRKAWKASQGRKLIWWSLGFKVSILIKCGILLLVLWFFFLVSVQPATLACSSIWWLMDKTWHQSHPCFIFQAFLAVHWHSGLGLSSVYFCRFSRHLLRWYRSLDSQLF